MMSIEHTCKNCKYYLSVDVFRGICKLSKETVLPDKEATANFEKNQKCKFCANFSCSENNEFLGKCMMNYDAYPDMTAVTCELFKWK